MTLGIDIDDTITDTTKNIYKYLKEFDPKCCDYHNLELEKYEEFMKCYVDDIMESDPLKEGVKEFFDYCASKNHKIIIITARNNDYTNNTFTITEKYLENYCLKYDKIVFEQSEKGECAHSNNVNLFIDDKENVLDGVHSYGIECIRFTDKESKHQAFDSWKEILEYIKQKEV